MKRNVVIQNMVAEEAAPEDEQLIEWASTALKNCDSSDAELTIRIVSTDEMRNLNKKYREKDKPTNVLSFPFEPPPGMPGVSGMPQPYLGDIAICADVVNAEAESQNKTFDAHWAHMVVHGIYHLLGHDHQEEEEAALMEGLETATLKALGFDDPYITGDKIEDHE